MTRTFSANLWTNQSATDSLHVEALSYVALSNESGCVVQHSLLTDGRSTESLGFYQDGAAHPSEGVGVFAITPFFNHSVCNIYPVQMIGPPSNYHAMTFNEAFEELLNLRFDSLYGSTKYNGSGSVDGRPCDVWSLEERSLTARFCVEVASGGLLSANYSEVQGAIFVSSTNVMHNLSTSPPAVMFHPPPASACVDLRPMPPPIATVQAAAVLAEETAAEEELNNSDRLARINVAAGGLWRAGKSSLRCEGGKYCTTVAEASLRLMPSRQQSQRGHDRAPTTAEIETVRAQQLQQWQRPSESPAQDLDIPVSFDARHEWGSSCPTLFAIREQGLCGSCWSFGAVEALADRLCIHATQTRGQLRQGTESSGEARAGAGRLKPLPPPAANLSVEYLLDCDSLDHRCGGGLLDDAWRFLNRCVLSVL